MTEDGSTGIEGIGGEASTLAEFLGYMRDGVIGKALDLADEAGARAGVPSGTSLAWLVRHLTVAERFWFCGIEVDTWSAASAPPPGVALAVLLDDYRRAVREADAVIAGWSDLDRVVDLGRGRPRCTARWILQHMITETARHAGHADILREQIDGVVGR